VWSTVLAAVISLLSQAAAPADEMPDAHARAPSTRPTTQRSADSEVALNQGLLRLETGDAAGAATILSSALNRFPSDADTLAMHDLALAHEKAELDKAFSLSLAVGYEYSTDLIILDRPIAAQGVSSPFNAVTVNPSASLTLARNDWIRVGIQTIDYLVGLSEINSDIGYGSWEYVASYQAGPFAEFTLSKTSFLTIDYGLQYVMLPTGDWGATRNAVTANLTVAEPYLGATSCSYQYANESFTPFFNQGVLFTDQNNNPSPLYSQGGVAHIVGVAQTIDMPKFTSSRRKAAQVELGFSYEYKDAMEPEFRSDQYTTCISVRAPMTDSLLADAGARFGRSFYSNGHDDEVEFSAGLTQRIADNVAFRVEYDFLKHLSSRFGYEYQPSAGGVEVEPYRFLRKTLTAELVFDF